MGRRRVYVTEAGVVYVTHASGDARHPPGEMVLTDEQADRFRADGCYERGRGRHRRTVTVLVEFAELVPE